MAEARTNPTPPPTSGLTAEEEEEEEALGVTRLAMLNILKVGEGVVEEEIESEFSSRDSDV